jgi:hypothetical protein
LEEFAPLGSVLRFATESGNRSANSAQVDRRLDFELGKKGVRNTWRGAAGTIAQACRSFNG